MTSTGIYKGLGDGRNSSKVLKPPGGGSSDIFGASESTSPRRVKPSQTSTLGSAFFNDDTSSGTTASTPSSNGSSAPETPRNKPGNDSHNRLFGPPDVPPPSTPKFHMRSTISMNNIDNEQHRRPKPDNYSLNGNANDANVTTNHHHNDVVDGNPVLGVGYDVVTPTSPVQNGTSNGNSAASSSAGSEKSSTDSSPSGQPVQRLKNRVPPGGFSSGLW